MIMKLNNSPGGGSCPGLSLITGKTELLVRFAPNMVSLKAALTKENGPSPSSVEERDSKTGSEKDYKLCGNTSTSTRNSKREGPRSYAP